MIKQGFDFLSADVPGGFWVWIALLFIGSFIVWFVYRTSEVVDRRKFIKWLTWIFVLSIFVYGGLWWIFRLPVRHERIALATTEGFSTNDSQAENYALQYETFLKLSRWLPPKKFIVYHPDWIYRIIPENSATNADSIRSLFKKMKVDRILWIGWNPGRHIFTCVSEDTHSGNHRRRFSIYGNSLSSALGKWVREFYAGRDSLQGAVRLRRVDFPVFSDERLSFARGKLELLQNDLTVSQNTFQQLLAKNPESAPGLAGLAEVCLQKAIKKQEQGRYLIDDLAMTYSTVVQAGKIEPDWSLVHLLEGKYYILMEIWSKAQESLFKSFHLYPNDDALYVALSRLHPSRLRKIGFYSIRQTLNRAIFMNPASIPGHLFLADALYRQQDLAGAEKTYRDLLAFNPNLKDALMELGKFDINRARYAKAGQIFKGILKRDSTDADAIYNLGIISYLKGNPDQAIRYFQKALEKGNIINAYLYLSKIYEQKGDRNKAIAYLRKRIHTQLGPNDSFAEEARKHLVFLLNKKGKE